MMYPFYALYKLKPMGDLPSNVERINYDVVNSRMADLRKSSIDFLKNIKS